MIFYRPVNEASDETGIESSAQHATDASLADHPLLHSFRQKSPQLGLDASSDQLFRQLAIAFGAFLRLHIVQSQQGFVARKSLRPMKSLLSDKLDLGFE